MTDKEIIQALECCGKNHITGSTDVCEHCFLQNSAKCVTELIYKSLDLINRQQAEIERLQKHSKKVLETCSRVTKANDERNNEIFQGAIEVVRAESIKEFAERLKKLTEQTAFADCWSEGGFLESIDDLVKESTEPSLLDKKFGGEQG